VITATVLPGYAAIAAIEEGLGEPLAAFEKQ
jgi:hypothetical protein